MSSGTWGQDDPGCCRFCSLGLRPSTPGGLGTRVGVEDDSDSEGDIKEEEGSRFILQEEWLADVCGVSRRR